MTKVSELTGRKLDEWVARAEGHRVALYTSDGGPDILAVTSKDDGRTRIISGGTAFEWMRSGTYHPSTDPNDGQIIMERERISSAGNYLRDGSGRLPEGEEWMCAARGGAMAVGPTMLVAGMRCRVAMVYGDEVPA